MTSTNVERALLPVSRMFLAITGVCLCLLLSLLSHVSAGEWSRFRGPNGTGVADGDESLPAEIGPDKNLLWKTAVPEGISSPVIGGGRVFLTTMDDGSKTGTMSLDVKTGQVLWHVDAPVVRKAKGKRLASATPVTDGQRVIAFFESCGLVCYGVDGNLRWQKDFGPINNQFNHAASPILIDDLVILVVDHDDDSFLVALDTQTGEEVWRCYRFVFGRNYASPVIWSFDDRQFVVVTGSGLVTGYDVKTGIPAWYIRGTSAVVNPTPVVGDNGLLFVHGSSPSSGAKSSSFRSLIKRHDKSDDGTLQAAELPNSFLRTFHERFDGDASGGIDEQEYSRFEEVSRPFVKGMVAYKPGGVGDLTETNVAWTESRSMPRTPSAIYYKSILYVVNGGGVLHSIDATSGKVIHKDRIAARGTIYSSPSLGDGKIYIGTRDGEVAVVSAEPEWKDLHSADLGGEIQASPAIADGRIYFRTDKTLYCFGLETAPK